MSPSLYRFRFIVFGMLFLFCGSVSAQNQDGAAVSNGTLEMLGAGMGKPAAREPERLPPPKKPVALPSPVQPNTAQNPIAQASFSKTPASRTPAALPSPSPRPFGPENMTRGTANPNPAPEEPTADGGEPTAEDGLPTAEAVPHDSVLDKPLVSKRKSANGTANGAANGTEGGETETPSAGWRDKLAKPKLSSNMMPVITVVGSLLIVTAAFFMVASFLRKVSPKGMQPLPKEAFENLGRIYLSQKHQLHLLRLGNRVILVSAMPDNVKTISEISDPDEVLTLLGMCRRGDPHSASALFQKSVADMSAEDLNRPIITSSAPRRNNPQRSSGIDLYSDPEVGHGEESIADILAGSRRHRRG